MKLLIVEDNERVAQFLKKGLRESGHDVDHAANGRDGMLLATSAAYDSIIIDRMLPGGIDGLGIVQALRMSGNIVPILILSAMAEIDDRIRGLQSGADDYLVKPFAFTELLARLNALARRSRDSAASTYLMVADLHMDLLGSKVYRAGKEITLQPREFRLLQYLILHVNQVVTRTMLLQSIWNFDFDPQTNVIDVHISKLRQKIDTGASSSLLKTIRGAGYMLSDE